MSLKVIETGTIQKLGRQTISQIQQPILEEPIACNSPSIYTLNKTGLRTSPCFTPLVTLNQRNWLPLLITRVTWHTAWLTIVRWLLVNLCQVNTETVCSNLLMSLLFLKAKLMSWGKLIEFVTKKIEHTSIKISSYTELKAMPTLLQRR